MERHKNVLNKKFLQLRMIFVSLFAKVCLGKEVEKMQYHCIPQYFRSISICPFSADIGNAIPENGTAIAFHW